MVSLSGLKSGHPIYDSDGFILHHDTIQITVLKA